MVKDRRWGLRAIPKEREVKYIDITVGSDGTEVRYAWGFSDESLNSAECMFPTLKEAEEYADAHNASIH